MMTPEMAQEFAGALEYTPYTPQDLAEAWHQMEAQGSVQAVCDVCGIEKTIEPDAEYTCKGAASTSCEGLITSPILAAGLI